MKLTAASISKLEAPKAKPKKYYDESVKPLFLKHTPTGRQGWYVHLKLPNGKYTDKKLGDYQMFSVSEARNEALKMLLECRRGTNPVQRKRRDEAGTLRGFIDKKYKSYVLQNHKDATNTLRVLQDTFDEFSDTSLGDITVSAVEEWRLRRLKEKTPKGTRVQPQTINRNTALLKAALGKARIWGIIEKNPLDDLSLLKVDKKPVEFLNDKQVEQLMKALRKRDQKKIRERQQYNEWCIARGKEPLLDPSVDLEISFFDYLTPLVTLLLHSGLRLGEALNMKWSDISDENVLTVTAGKTRSFRYVPLSFDAQMALRHWKRLHDVTTESHGRELIDTVFVTMGRGATGSTPRPLRSVKTSWGNIAATLPFHCDLRTLRRTFGASLARKGVPMYTISKLLGHTSVTTTQQWYTNLSMGEYREAVSLLNTVDF
jgi:integrase